MKKTKRQETKTAAAAAGAPRPIMWWPWVSAGVALLVVYQIYAPALNGPFVLDDRYLPYFSAHTSDRFGDWVGLLRPLLMASYWLNFTMAGGAEPFPFHATNVLIHFATALMATLIMMKLIEWAGVSGKVRLGLAVVSGAIFLLHPLQTEAVAYTAGRSDSLSGLFYYAAFAVFLWRRGESIGWLEALAVLALFACAIGTKENTLTFPALLLLTDYFWGRGSVKKNWILYSGLAVAAVFGAAMVWRIIRNQETAGFHTEGITPAMYFFTQCRVIWGYIRLFFLPAGQNIDPDIPLSQSVLDHGAIVGLIGLGGLAGAAWIYRRKFPLAAFGILTFLLLIAPVASFVPIKDVMSERRLYLPMIGLLLVCCEFLRRLTFARIIQAGAVVLAICCVLTYKRNQVWASPVTLWEDAVEKSPEKYRPRFQLAYAQFERHQCPAAVRSYEAASKLQTPDNELLVDWALALDCMDRLDEAMDKLKIALQRGETAHLRTQVARIYMRKKEWNQALAELDTAEKLDPHYDVTYLYRGNIMHIQGDVLGAARELQHALQLNPDNEITKAALAQLRTR